MMRWDGREMQEHKVWGWSELDSYSNYHLQLSDLGLATEHLSESEDSASVKWGEFQVETLQVVTSGSKKLSPDN